MWVEKNGRTYRIRDKLGEDKVTVKSGFATKTAALDHMTGLKADKLRGKALVHRGGEVQLNDWLDDWWPSYETGLKPSARISAEGILNRYVRPMLGGHELDDITRLAVARWVGDLRAGRTHVAKPRPLARKTIANAHGLLHKVMAEAVEAKLIGENPCRKTKLGQKEHHEMVFLTEQQAEAIVRAMPQHYRPLVLFLLGTGCRWAEGIGLRVKDIDLLERRVTINKSLQELRDHAGFVEVEPKTAHSRRSLKITLDLALAMTALIADKRPGDRVFLAPRGGNVRYRPFWERWDKARDLAGVPGCRIHDMRHTHAAWLIASNIRGGLTAVQRRLGHSSIRVTSDLYGHLMPEVDDDIMAALDARMPATIWGANNDQADPADAGAVEDLDLPEGRGLVGELVGQERAKEGE